MHAWRKTVYLDLKIQFISIWKSSLSLFENPVCDCSWSYQMPYTDQIAQYVSTYFWVTIYNIMTVGILVIVGYLTYTGCPRSLSTFNIVTLNVQNGSRLLEHTVQCNRRYNIPCSNEKIWFMVYSSVNKFYLHLYEFFFSINIGKRNEPQSKIF